MKFSCFLGASLSAMAAGFALAAATYVPIACGCLGPVEAFAYGFDIPSDLLVSPDEATPSKIRRELLHRYARVPAPLPENMPGAPMQDLPCGHAYRPVNKFDCRYWLWQAQGSQRGVRLVFTLGQSRVLKDVQVEYIDRQSGKFP